MVLSDKIDDAQRQKFAEGKIALVIASFTDSFFADDPTGRTIFGYDISAIRVKQDAVQRISCSSQNGASLIPSLSLVDFPSRTQ